MNLEEIFSTYKQQVYNLALHYLQNTEEAEEITQDVFLKIHLNHSSFNEKSQLSTWIYRITINCCLDALKAKKRKKRWAIFGSLFQSDDSFEDSEFNHPGIQLEQKEATEHILNLINQLPENQKTALILNKIENLSQQEIALILETTPKAVESLIQRAKNNLEKKLNSSRGNT